MSTLSPTYEGVFAAHLSAEFIVHRSKQIHWWHYVLQFCALGDLGIIVNIYFNETDLLALALHKVPELHAESIILMSTGAKWRPVKLKPLYDALGLNKTSSSTRVSCTYWCRHHWTQDTGKTKTYILQDVPESSRRGLEVGMYPSGQVAAMNKSCFQPYCCDSDAGKIAHTACTLSSQHLCTGHSCRIHYAGSCSPD